MKFQWTKDSSDIKDISEKQLDWLFSGLSTDHKKSLKDVDISSFQYGRSSPSKFRY